MNVSKISLAVEDDDEKVSGEKERISSFCIALYRNLFLISPQHEEALEEGEGINGQTRCILLANLVNVPS